MSLTNEEKKGMAYLVGIVLSTLDTVGASDAARDDLMMVVKHLGIPPSYLIAAAAQQNGPAEQTMAELIQKERAN